MKKIIATTAVLASSVAFAGDYKINLEGRTDLTMATVKTTAQAGTKTEEKYTNFSNQLIRANFLAVVNDNLSFRFRYRFAKESAHPATNNTSTTASATTLREITTSTQVDYFFVDHKNSMFTTRFGKQNWGGAVTGREGIVSGTDVFLSSAANNNYKTAFGSDYRYGVTAMFKFMDSQSLDLAISNPNSTITDSTGNTRKNNGLAYTVIYSGNFSNKLLQPVLSYSMATQDGDSDASTKKVDYTIWNAGMRSEFAGFTIDADYKQLTKPDRNTSGATTAANKKQETTSLYANVAYAMGDFTPIATYINDKYKTADTVTATNANFKKNSFAIGTYWKPMADVNFRYHLMYTSIKTEFEGTVATNKEFSDNRFLFGFKADI